VQKHQNDKNMLQTKRKINKKFKKDHPGSMWLVLFQVDKANLQSTRSIRLTLLQTNSACIRMQTQNLKPPKQPAWYFYQKQKDKAMPSWVILILVIVCYVFK
jgi:hypothetical protein